MRELRFRAWVFYGERLKKPNYSRDYDSLDRFFEDHDENDIDQCIELYTGLKDKNGKEIYEGDIIHRGALSKANIFRNSVIRFDKESVGFIATSTRNGARTLFNGHTCDEINVIGNIHENPELLKKEK